MRPELLNRVASELNSLEAQPVVDRLLGLCTELLHVTGASLAMIDDGEHRGAIAVSHPAVGTLDELQFSLGEGPCLDADGSARPVLEPDLAGAAGRWPAFAPAAAVNGAAAVFAFPLRVGAARLGVLSLYRDTSGALDDAELGDAIALSRVMTHVLLELEAHLTPGVIPDRLAEILDDRAHVHQATGMIAAQLHADVATALSRLRAYAWARDRTIDGVASDVIARVIRFNET